MAVDTEALDYNYRVSLEDIHAAYDALSLKEEAVIASLDQILSNQVNLDKRLASQPKRVQSASRGCMTLYTGSFVVALAEEDYEQATTHIHRFLAMDESLLWCTPGKGRVGGGVELEGSLPMMHEEEDRVVAKRFDEMVKGEDLASIERFFKI